MVNESLQWALLVALVFLILGAFRQIALIVPPDLRAVPSGPAVGDPLPNRTLASVHSALGWTASPKAEDTTIAFITESCVGCRQLVSNAVRAVEGGRIANLVFLAREPSQQYLRALEETGVPLVADGDGKHWAACDITATPLVVRVGADGKVKSREVMHRVEDRAASAVS